MQKITGWFLNSIDYDKINNKNETESKTKHKIKPNLKIKLEGDIKIETKNGVVSRKKLEPRFKFVEINDKDFIVTTIKIKTLNEIKKLKKVIRISPFKEETKRYEEIKKPKKDPFWWSFYDFYELPEMVEITTNAWHRISIKTKYLPKIKFKKYPY